MALLAQGLDKGAGAPSIVASPEFFYVGSFDGNAWMIIDVQPASAWDSKVRFIQVYSVCGAYHVQEDDYVFENVPVQEVASNADICSPDEIVSPLIKPFKTEHENTAGDGVTQGIEAQCGTEKVVHRLPASQSLHFRMLKHNAPRIAALWTLAQDIRQRYVDAGHELVVRSSYVHNPARVQNRHQSEQAAIEIRNGNYDLALPELPERWRLEGQTKLSQVIPGPEEATAPEEDFGTIENVEQLGVNGPQTAPYPPLARIANIQGDVSLKVYVEVETGNVLRVVALSGHPLLAQAASEAINKWKFLLPYTGENPLSVVVHYKRQCPPTIETITSTSKAQKHSRKKARKK